MQSDLLKGLISASFTTQSPWPGMVPLIFLNWRKSRYHRDSLCARCGLKTARCTLSRLWLTQGVSCATLGFENIDISPYVAIHLSKKHEFYTARNPFFKIPGLSTILIQVDSASIYLILINTITLIVYRFICSTLFVVPNTLRIRKTFFSL